MRNFNLDDFKKWIDDHDEESNQQGFSEGDLVRPSIPFKKLVNRINEEDGDRKEICKEFYTDGGTVVDYDAKNLIIEVESGTFSISKIYVELS